MLYNSLGMAERLSKPFHGIKDVEHLATLLLMVPKQKTKDMVFCKIIKAKILVFT